MEIKACGGFIFFFDGHYFFYLKVQSICVILSKSLNRHQRYQREAAAAALSEFVRYRYALDVNKDTLHFVGYIKILLFS